MSQNYVEKGVGVGWVEERNPPRLMLSMSHESKGGSSGFAVRSTNTVFLWVAPTGNFHIAPLPASLETSSRGSKRMWGIESPAGATLQLKASLECAGYPRMNQLFWFEPCWFMLAGGSRTSTHPTRRYKYAYLYSRATSEADLDKTKACETS